MSYPHCSMCVAMTSVPLRMSLQTLWTGGREGDLCAKEQLHIPVLELHSSSADEAYKRRNDNCKEELGPDWPVRARLLLYSNVCGTLAAAACH